MAINFTGEFTTPRSPEEVFEFLSDPDKFASLFPDFEGMAVQDATHFTVRLGVAVGNLRGNAELKMELAEATHPQRALYKGAGTAIGSQVGISAGFDLSAAPEGTRVAWQGEADVSGKLAAIGGMIEPLVLKNLQKLIASLQSALRMPPAAEMKKEAVPEAVPVAPVVAGEEIPTVPVEAPAGRADEPI